MTMFSLNMGASLANTSPMPHNKFSLFQVQCQFLQPFLMSPDLETTPHLGEILFLTSSETFNGSPWPLAAQIPWSGIQGPAVYIQP